MRRALPLAVILASLALTAHAQITIDDSGTASESAITGTFTLSDFFDAGGSDKLVVTISMERDRGDPNTRIAEVTYNDIPLIEAIQFKDSVDYEPPGIGPAAVFYLDDPGPAGALVARGSAKMNSCHASWLAISGTAEGVGPTNGTTEASTSITTAVNDSLVVAHNHVNAGTVPEAQEPLTPLLSSNGRWSEAASGYQVVSAPGTTVTPTFSEGLTPVTVAAVFEPLDVITPNQFKRGDSNRDGGVNIADGVYILQNIFAQGPDILCPDAGDANDDENVNIADAVYILQNIFAQGAPFPAPGPDACGPDPTPHPTGGPELPPCDYCPAACATPPEACPAPARQQGPAKDAI